MRPLSYVVCDVFTDRPLTGNALAVFTDASELSSPQMQALAREMNLSESSFVVSPGGDADAGLRIFTPTMELPFAGHPTLGTALALAKGSDDVLRLETGRGVVTVRLAGVSGGAGFGWMTQPLPTREPLKCASSLPAKAFQRTPPRARLPAPSRPTSPAMAASPWAANS